jgi:hypothetical protein
MQGVGYAKWQAPQSRWFEQRTQDQGGLEAQAGWISSLAQAELGSKWDRR